MRLLALCSGSLNLGQHRISFFGHSENFLGNTVCKFAQRKRYCLRFNVTCRKVDCVAVHGVVSDKAASISNFLQLRGQPQRFDLLRKVVSFCSTRIDHAFDTYPQQSTGGARGQIDDLLSFFKNFSCVFWHAIGSKDPGACRVGNFPSNFKNKISAVRASPEANLFRFIKLALVCLGAKTCAKGSTVVVSIGSHFAAFIEAFQNWVLSKYCGGSAVWASHGFSFCHWRNV